MVINTFQIYMYVEVIYVCIYVFIMYVENFVTRIYASYEKSLFFSGVSRKMLSVLYRTV